jgi:hypothetical protein
MKLFRIENKQNGIRYFTPDMIYRIRKTYKRAKWELTKFNGKNYDKYLYFDSFREAYNFLTDIITLKELYTKYEYYINY